MHCLLFQEDRQIQSLSPSSFSTKKIVIIYEQTGVLGTVLGLLRWRRTESEHSLAKGMNENDSAEAISRIS